MPRKGGPIQKRPIANVDKVIVVASGKGGVGKSTVALNLAFALALRKNERMNTPLRVGLLDLDIFGPSIPTLMGLRNAGEPALSSGGAILPMTNHGLPCMSMGFLLPSTNSASLEENDNTDTPIVWRGLMVQKAVQQLLFDVDWSKDGNGLDVLVVDMPPGTGDVPLTLGQLVTVDGSVIVSTPQDVALSDVRKGIAMLRKVSVPITGLILNQAYYLCPGCGTGIPRYLFGKPDNFNNVAQKLDVPVLGELPLVEGVSSGADAGYPYVLSSIDAVKSSDGEGGLTWRSNMAQVAEKVAASLWKTS
ncbi:P-loop containing nucleoside triphosphate hydrolase protein [Gymnopilus junonius]|uniref:P-loop containing nucleoside triphosphate hydrolase protein n=1 Tax=Gymnopilus junonius TaxID=109634 RepID=A0A9P5NA91_GYMJU|nr:P-loop containing nucleoside triphosphate hydrolase protein [Gymnopilus junonius]